MSQAWVKEKKSKSSRRNEVRDLLMRIVDKVNLKVVKLLNYSSLLCIEMTDVVSKSLSTCIRSTI